MILDQIDRRRIDAFIYEVTRCFGVAPMSITLRQGEMEMEYENRNRGALFKNDRKADEKDRDYAGTLDVDGTEYWLSGWVRTSKSGQKYLSLSVKPKQASRQRKSDVDDDNFGRKHPLHADSSDGLRCRTR
jgi:hypothetical protein